MKTLERAIKIGQSKMNDAKVRDRKALLTNLSELCFYFCSLNESENIISKDFDVTLLHNEVIKELHGENSA